MAIWSLTQERVEKLMTQIGDKEDEIDALIKLTPKDLWNIDLEAFVEEWNLQLVEEADRAKKIQRMGRRASHKLGIGASKGGKAKKKRKMGSDSDDDSGSDSDFGPVKKKPKAKKEGLLSYLREADVPSKEPSPAIPAKSTFGSTAPQKSTQTNLLSHLKADVKKESPPQTDGLSSPAEPEPAAKPRGRPAAAKKAAPVISDDEEDESDVFAVVAKEEAKKPAAAPKTNGRAPRAAAAKPVSKYSVDTDSDDDDDLGDVSTMVKSIGGTTNGVPLFKTSTRPGSSSGMPKVPKKASPSVIDIDEGDTTNYEALMPVASPRKPAPRNVNDTMLSDSEDDFSLVKPKPAAPKLSKVTAKAKPVPKAKVSAATVTKKSTALSPAAKAYAKRLEKDEPVGASKPKPAPAKKPKAIDSDEEMDDADTLANEILSDDDDDDEPTPKPKAASRAPAARPGRRAAAKPAKYVVSDDDEDDASEASFDDDSE
jgi:DNA topoisomerase-2